MMVLFLALGCSSDPGPVVDGWEVARDILRTDKMNCHHHILAYCERDPKFIDPILQRVLEQSFHGQMPNTERGARAVARRAVGSYLSQQVDTEEARARLTRRIEAYYQDPSVEDEGAIRRVEMGVVPGRWEKRGRSGFTMVPTTRWDGTDWSIAEVARFAERYAEPGVSLVELSVSLPVPGAAGGYHAQVWRYSASTRRIWLTLLDRPTDAWYSDRVTDWSVFRARAEKMKRSDLHFCTLVDKNWNEDDACPL